MILAQRPIRNPLRPTFSQKPYKLKTLRKSQKQQPPKKPLSNRKNFGIQYETQSKLRLQLLKLSLAFKERYKDSPHRSQVLMFVFVRPLLARCGPSGILRRLLTSSFLFYLSEIAPVMWFLRPTCSCSFRQGLEAYSEAYWKPRK